MFEKLIKSDSSTVKMHLVWKMFRVIVGLFLLVFWISVMFGGPET